MILRDLSNGADGSFTQYWGDAIFSFVNMLGRLYRSRDV
jgi:hypothetical protein